MRCKAEDTSSTVDWRMHITICSVGSPRPVHSIYGLHIYFLHTPKLYTCHCQRQQLARPSTLALIGVNTSGTSEDSQIFLTFFYRLHFSVRAARVHPVLSLPMTRLPQFDELWNPRGRWLASPAYHMRQRWLANDRYHFAKKISSYESRFAVHVQVLMKPSLPNAPPLNWGMQKSSLL